MRCSAAQAQQRRALRFSGNSLGSRVITGMAYVLEKAVPKGGLDPNQFRSGWPLLDLTGVTVAAGPLDNANHPAYVDLGGPTGFGRTDVLQGRHQPDSVADNDPSVSFALEYLIPRAHHRRQHVRTVLMAIEPAEKGMLQPSLIAG